MNTAFLLLLAALVACGAAKAASPQCYTGAVVKFESDPVLSYIRGTSTFAQVFNPSWIVPSAGTGQRQGLLIRTQNCSGAGCSYPAANQCCRCSGTGAAASVLTFAELLNSDDDPSTTPIFANVTADSVVFGPHDNSDSKGTEDPRVAYDPTSGLYYVFYTCYGPANVDLCLATTTDPTRAGAAWTRHGPVGFPQSSKSAALLIRPQPPHYLYWGAGTIHITTSDNLLNWTAGVPFITHTPFGNPFVESGPPPMLLSTGDYVFFHNSWGQAPGYQPTFVILNGSNPSQILAEGQQPLWSPQLQPWMEGNAPYTCNVADVAFLEAAHPTGQPDEFRVYFGGSDAVVGSAIVQITRTGSPCNP